MNIILPDASVKNLPENATGFDAAQSIGPRLAKEALAIKVNGVLTRPCGAASRQCPYSGHNL